MKYLSFFDVKSIVETTEENVIVTFSRNLKYILSFYCLISLFVTLLRFFYKESLEK